jgi:hypothetical protein
MVSAQYMGYGWFMHGERDKRDKQSKGFWWQDNRAEADVCVLPPRPGQRCPECGEGVLAYDSLFVLTCPHCHYVAESGACS